MSAGSYRAPTGLPQSGAPAELQHGACSTPTGILQGSGRVPAGLLQGSHRTPAGFIQGSCGAAAGPWAGFLHSSCIYPTDRLQGSRRAHMTSCMAHTGLLQGCRAAAGPPYYAVFRQGSDTARTVVPQCPYLAPTGLLQNSHELQGSSEHLQSARRSPTGHRRCPYRDPTGSGAPTEVL